MYCLIFDIWWGTETPLILILWKISRDFLKLPSTHLKRCIVDTVHWNFKRFWFENLVSKKSCLEVHKVEWDFWLFSSCLFPKILLFLKIVLPSFPICMQSYKLDSFSTYVLTNVVSKFDWLLTVYFLTFEELLSTEQLAQTKVAWFSQLLADYWAQSWSLVSTPCFSQLCL